MRIEYPELKFQASYEREDLYKYEDIVITFCRFNECFSHPFFDHISCDRELALKKIPNNLKMIILLHNTHHLTL
mgnify:CR=1 FL=1